MTDHNPFGCSGREYPLDRPSPMTTYPRSICENSDSKHQLFHLVRNLYEKLSDPQQGASLVGYSEEMTVREVLDLLLLNSGEGPGNILELLKGKVDKESGKQLSDENYTLDEKNKLAFLENFDDSTIQAALATKVDKVVGKGLSEEDFTTELKDKLKSLDPGGGGTPVTAEQVKQLYESNPDTNVFTDADVVALAGMQPQIDDINLLIGDVVTALDAINGEVV